VILSPPRVEEVILNSTLGTNLTEENLTVYPSVIDYDGDDIKTVYNWYVDEESIVLLNMPFDTNLTAEDGTKVRDYSPYMTNGTLGNGVTTSLFPKWKATEGFDGRGAYFYDTTDYIDTAAYVNQTFGTTGATFSAWVKPTGSATGYIIYTQNGGVDWTLWRSNTNI